MIEDEPVIAWELERKLNLWGFKDAIVRESMEESREILVNGSCDIVISNLKLIDGWIDHDFVQLLNQGKTHLIILTGLGNENLHELDWSPIHPSFLFKPYTSFQLKRILQAS